MKQVGRPTKTCYRLKATNCTEWETGSEIKTPRFGMYRISIAFRLHPDRAYNPSISTSCKRREISGHIGNVSAKECQRHYTTVYLESRRDSYPLPDMSLLSSADVRSTSQPGAAQSMSTSEQRVPASLAESSSATGAPMENGSPPSRNVISAA